MQIKPPQVGQVYVSQIDPDLTVYVVAVTSIEGDEGFTVEACDPVYKDNTDYADGLDITADIWAKHGFVLSPE